MYTSNYTTTLRYEELEEERRRGEFHVKTQPQSETDQYAKKCPACGGNLVELKDKFEEISEPRGPGPPLATTTANQQRPRSRETSPERRYKQSNHQTQNRDNYYSYNNKTQQQYGSYGNYYDSQNYPNYHQSQQGSDIKQQQDGIYSQLGQVKQHTNYYNQSGGHYASQDNYTGYSIQGQGYSGKQDYYHSQGGFGITNQTPSDQDQQQYPNQTPDEDNSGGWYCTTCGFHVRPNDRIIEVNMTSKEKEDVQMETEQASPAAAAAAADISEDNKDSNKSIDEEYITWENQINKDFSDFLVHIKAYFSDKEYKLKEYQVDLCQREKSLQSNESYFTGRMDTLKKAEEEFQDKVERLNLQVQDRMQRLREYEARITRINTNQKNKYREISTQTVISTPNEFYKSNRGYYNNDGSSSHLPPQASTSLTRNFGYVQNRNKINAGGINRTINRERLSQVPQPQVADAYSSNRQRFENGPPKQHKTGVVGNGITGDSDYMYMGDVTKTSNTSPISPKESIAGSPYYIDIKHVSKSPTKDLQQSSPDQAPQTLSRYQQNGVDGYVDTSNGTNAGDSGFNTPDQDFLINNNYSYPETNGQYSSRPRPASRPPVVDLKYPHTLKSINSSNNSNNNVTLESPSANSSSTRNSNTSLNYSGERAVLVKSPNGIEAYTTRAQKFRNSAIHRSSSLPQKRGSRSPSPDGDRSQSMPPDPEIVEGLDMENNNNPPKRPQSENILDKPSQLLDGEVSPDSQRSRTSSLGSKGDQGHSSRRVTSPAPKPMTPTRSRLPRDRKPKHPDVSGEAKDSSSDSNKVILTNNIGLRSRSSESVQRSGFGYKYLKQSKLLEARKKAQSDLNLSTDKWGEEQNDENDIVIAHRKSTSFDSPRSKSYINHEYLSNTSYSQTNPKITESVKIEISQNDGYSNNIQPPTNMKHITADNNQGGGISLHDSYPENLRPDKPMSEKPRIRGRRSDMSMPHRKLNKMNYYTASGTHLNPQPGVYDNSNTQVSYNSHINDQVYVVEKNTEPKYGQSYQNSYPMSGLSTFKGGSLVKSNPPTSLSTKQYSVPETRNPGSDRHLNIHNDISPEIKDSRLPYTNPGYNGYVENNKPSSVVYPENKNGLHVEVSNEASRNNNESPEMTSTPRDYDGSKLPNGYQDSSTVYTHPSGAQIKFHNGMQPVNNSLQNVSTQQQPSSTTTYHNNLQQPENNYQNMQYQQRYTRNPNTAVNVNGGRIDLLDKSTWAIKRRRDVKMSAPADSNNNNFNHSRQSSVTNSSSHFGNGESNQLPPQHSPSAAAHEYINVYPNHTNSNVVAARHKPQADFTRNDPVDYRNEQLLPHHRAGKTISYIPSDNIVYPADKTHLKPTTGTSNDVHAHTKENEPHKEHSKKNGKSGSGNTNMDEVFLTNENNNPGKKKYFGFSPRYKDILFKYNGGKNDDKNADKPSPKKKDKKAQESPITISSSTTRFGFKKSDKSAEKEGKNNKKEKERPRPTSPRTKLPHYSTYIKEITK